MPKITKAELHTRRMTLRKKMKHPTWSDHVLRGRRRFTSATRMKLPTVLKG